MKEEQKMCPKCKSVKRVKHGIVKGMQRYKCKECGCNYTKSQKQGYSLEKRKEAIKYYLEGIGFRKIERLLGISNVTVLYWVRELGRKLCLQKISNSKVDVLELDELSTYVKKKKIDVGCGLQLREIPKKYWEHMLATDQQ